MRSTAPAAVAASMSCSRARLVALRRQADGARRSHDVRTDQRHPVKSFSIRAPMPVSPTPAQARSAESVDQADSERQERPDCVNRNEPGEQGCTMPTSVPTSVPGRIACMPPPLGSASRFPGSPTRARAHADVGRKMPRLPSAHRGAPPLAAHPNGTTTTATPTCTHRGAMKPRFPVNDRTPGTALAVCLPGTGRGRRHETHDGRGRGHIEDPSCFPPPPSLSEQQAAGRRGYRCGAPDSVNPAPAS